MKRPDRTGIDYLLHAIIAIRWNKLSITWNIRVMGFANKCKERDFMMIKKVIINIYLK